MNRAFFSGFLSEMKKLAVSPGVGTPPSKQMNMPLKSKLGKRRMVGGGEIFPGQAPRLQCSMAGL